MAVMDVSLFTGKSLCHLVRRREAMGALAAPYTFAPIRHSTRLHALRAMHPRRLVFLGAATGSTDGGEAM